VPDGVVTVGVNGGTASRVRAGWSRPRVHTAHTGSSALSQQDHDPITHGQSKPCATAARAALGDPGSAAMCLGSCWDTRLGILSCVYKTVASSTAEGDRQSATFP
jgi:hypothetical protein